MEKRIAWIDYAKTIGIYLVVLAHTDLYFPLKSLINAFLMPLFFFMSGFLFSYAHNPSFKQFIVKRFRQLIVPYLWINLITYLFWLFIGSKFGNDSSADTLWYSPLINTLLGNGKGMVHDIPLWFLICLFFTESLYYLLFKRTNSFFLLIAVLVFFSFINYSYIHIYLPFSLNIAFVGLSFYTFGNVY